MIHKRIAVTVYQKDVGEEDEARGNCIFGVARRSVLKVLLKGKVASGCENPITDGRP